MSLSEWLSIIAYYAQLMAIFYGIRQMGKASIQRDKALEQQGKALEDMGAGIRELLQRTPRAA